MYPFILSIHNILRWVALILGIIAAVRAYLGWFNRREWTQTERRIGSFFAIAMDLQLLLGLILYFFISPLTRSALLDFSAAMRSADTRFFALEHALYMLLAVVFSHFGSIFSRRVEQAAGKFRRAAIWFSLALFMVVLGMPWMRPFFPWL